MELKRHRKAAKLTLQEIGDRLGMSPSPLSRLETGKREVDSDEVAAILAVIGVDRDGARVPTAALTPTVLNWPVTRR